MSERKWTEKQLCAINTRDRTLLVSAAAGSGKTATLTERIIRSILDEKDPISIKDMLIVTFTNAAVGELKERIGAAIKAEFIKDPTNLRLEEQLLTVKDARILTIDAFCNSVLRSCSGRVGLAPGYRIADEAELSLLSTSIMDGLIAAGFGGELDDICSAEEFSRIAECLTTARGERELAEVFISLYTSLEATEDGCATLRALIEEYKLSASAPITENRFCAYICAYAKEAATAYAGIYGELEQMQGRAGRDGKCAEKLMGELSALRAIAASQDYAQMRRLITEFEFIPLRGLSGDKSDSYLRIEAARAMLKADIKTLSQNFFSYTEEQLRELLEKLYSKLSVICAFIEKFDTLYTKEKKDRGICSYGDLERYAYLCLWENGERTDIANELKESFSAVYIDEYQDVNALQNKIFEAVSKENNRFMVGDIKQSIYGFRFARPEIFAKMKGAFPPLSEGYSSTAGIFMSDNFRCDKTVVDFVNEVFDTLFGSGGESIGYISEDRLSFAKVYPEGHAPTDTYPQINLCIKDDGAGIEAEDIIADELGKSEILAKAVAQKIKELLDTGRLASGEKPKPRDIAIILRSSRGRAEKYAAALSEYGIRSTVADEGEFFESEEVLLAISLLNAIDNPCRDIYLTALMCSPLYGFTPDELLMVRQSAKGCTLYEALLEFCKNEPGYEKGRKFISELNDYRHLAQGIRADELISRLYEQTGLMALAARHSRQTNLQLLHGYAARFEESSFGGLYSFISYINNLIEKGKKFDTGSGESEDSDTVKIMTAHRSKGLEFPICIYSEADSAIKHHDASRITLAEGFGACMLLKDESGMALVSNPVFHAINHYKAIKEYEEEMRILYVVLTRAREQLYIYGAISGSAADGIAEKCAVMRQMLSPYFVKKFPSTLQMMLTCAQSSCKINLLDRINAEEQTEILQMRGADNIADDSHKQSPKNAERTSELTAEELLSRFRYEYPFKYLSAVPEKLSVSLLSPSVLDGSEAEEVRLFASEQNTADESDGARIAQSRPQTPKFISGEGSDESAKRGIATHQFLQFCDLKRLSALGVSAELERLSALEFLSSADRARVRTEEIDAFVASPLFSEMADAKKLYRELRFNIRLPAEQFTESDELREALSGKTVLVQGVIDCIIERADGSLHLIDYKTDRLSKGELANEALAARRLIDAHSLQLSYYAEAVKRMFGKCPARIGIYSLHLGKEITVR